MLPHVSARIWGWRPVLTWAWVSGSLQNLYGKNREYRLFLPKYQFMLPWTMKIESCVARTSQGWAIEVKLSSIINAHWPPGDLGYPPCLRTHTVFVAFSKRVPKSPSVYPSANFIESMNFLLVCTLSRLSCLRIMDLFLIAPPSTHILLKNFK